MKKNNKIIVGILSGIICGLLDITPMLIMKMTWDTIVTAFIMCIIGGFFISTSNLKVKAFIKGIIIFILLALPLIITVGATSPQEIIPMIISNLILGALMGFLIGIFGK